ncbi:hypothetical protein [Anabaena sp. UHCC 0204]|uniref:hypothetical protein n=1 Tax=Anabaena sp. UHCC 0204 TaxID=2590009 RepID=UPI001446A90D|nr:hypothetical protein [Anabaena sp. UHCC 0204]MTJ10498.1 hypothetical protein [Anabaena sp. UHCC 0204]
MKTKLEDVFGVSSKPVLSYVERDQVDKRFIEALKSDKQIIVYGSSKQGKTALVSKYINYEQNVSVSLSPKTTILDIYSSILRQSGVSIQINFSESTSREASLGIVGKFKATLPFFGGSEIEGNNDLKSSVSKDYEHEEIPFNLALPQDISEILRKIKFNKFIILENFHYLDDQLQQEFAYDLRSFQEMGIRFIILGVWREKNKMVQFNGDLLDRIEEVPVEPWLEEDFLKVIKKGAEELSISFPQDLLNECHDISFKSIGVLQEILKEICISAGISEKQKTLTNISHNPHLKNAVSKKAEDYLVRHQRALEAIASGNSNSASSSPEGLTPLFLPYYLVRVILESGYEGLANGMKRSVLQTKIQDIHHRSNNVRASDMSNLLHNLAKLQNNKTISPPIIDYDRSTKYLQIVDSTFYFFLRHADLSEILQELPSPLDE